MHSHRNHDACYYRALRDILRGLLCYGHKPRATVRIDYGGFSVNFEGDFMATLPDDSQFDVTVSYVDAKGNPAKVDGAPAWSTDRSDLLNIVPAADGMSATISAVGPLGTGEVRVDADADLGAGVESLITLGSVEVVGSKAVAGTLTFGAPTPAP